MEAANIANFNGFTFSFEEKVTELVDVDVNEYCEVYSNIIVLESNNSKFPVGSKVEQISVVIKLHFEHEDGTEY